MTISRASKPTTIYTANGYDTYGTRSEYAETGSCQMYITLYSQNNTNDARYKDVTHVGYTSYMDLSDDMQLEQDDVKYDVLLVNSYAKKNVVFLRVV